MNFESGGQFMYETPPGLTNNTPTETSESSIRQKELASYLQEYLELSIEDVERIKLISVKDLPEHYQSQLSALADVRLEDVSIAVVPDNLWVKGSQPSESSADKQLILIKQSYFEVTEKPDEIAWLLHELAHCQSFIEAGSTEQYQASSEQPAFEDLHLAGTYPNNQVEKTTFTKQFQFLKNLGHSREEVLSMLSQYYAEEDLPFFNRLLDTVYGQ